VYNRVEVREMFEREEEGESFGYETTFEILQFGVPLKKAPTRNLETN
jgi:hypothetical protein